MSTDLLAGEEASPDVGTYLHLQLPVRGAGPVLLPLLFLFSSFFFHPTWLYGDLSYPFRFPRFSASVKQVLCENSSICRCILGEFVGTDELHALLVLHHLEKDCYSVFFISVIIFFNSD